MTGGHFGLGENCVSNFVVKLLSDSKILFLSVEKEAVYLQSSAKMSCRERGGCEFAVQRTQIRHEAVGMRITPMNNCLAGSELFTR